MPALGTLVPSLRRKGSTEIAKPPAGWVGSKAGKRGDLVTIDSNGRLDQAVAAGNNVGASTKLAFLKTALASGDAQGTACEAEKFDDDVLLELPVTNDDTAIATTNAMVGKQYELRRTTTTGYYVVNSNATTNVKVEVVAISKRYAVGEVGGTLLCRVLPAARVA